MGEGRWTPRWRFQPLENLDDAFWLLEKAVPQKYLLGSEGPGTFWVRVQIGGKSGEARGPSKSRVITYALAKALEIEVRK